MADELARELAASVDLGRGLAPSVDYSELRDGAPGSLAPSVDMGDARAATAAAVAAAAAAEAAAEAEASPLTIQVPGGAAGAAAGAAAAAAPPTPPAQRGSLRVTDGLLGEGSFVPDTSVFHAEYEIGHAVGTGSYSVVRLCQHRATGQVFAVKMIDKSRIAAQRRLRDEIAVLTRVKHAHIMAVLGVYETDAELYLVMEWAAGGELFDRIVARGYFTELSARGAVSKLLDALACLHAHNIVHRDIKPENILLVSQSDDELVKLSDFGLAKIFEQQDALEPSADGQTTRFRTYTSCGTDLYVAPEVLSGRGYDKAVDMWSIGVVMYILLCGFPPFESIASGQVDWNVDFPDPYWADVSPEAKDLLRHLLQVDPDARFTAEQALAHEWVTGRSLSRESRLSAEHMAEMRRFNAKRKASEQLDVVVEY